jgi:ABC-type uncharacterized transport system permease subunit
VVLWIRVGLAGLALAGTAAPVIAVSRWPEELPFIGVIVGGLAVSLVLYVLFVQTKAMSIATGAFISLFAVGLPIPGYPIYFFDVRYGFAAEGLLLFAIPPLCLMAWLIGFVIDIAMRSTAKSRHSPPI